MGGRAEPAPEIETAQMPAQRDLLAALPLAVLLLDRDDRVLSANTAAESLLGRAEAMLRGQPLPRVFGAAGAACDIVARVRQSGGEFVARDAALTEGSQAPRGDLRAAPAGEDGDFVLLVVEARQVAVGRSAAPAADGAARSASGLAAMLAHEIKNPLSGIRGAAQLLEKGDDPRIRQMAGLIRSEVDRIRGLIDAFEHFSDTRSVTRAPVNIHRVLDHVAELAAAGVAADCRLYKLYDPSLPPVLGERDRLVQIFLNLVKNAAEATAGMPGGPEIRLQTAYHPGIRLRRDAAAPLELPIAISVIDNGPGVAPEIADHLFDPFVTGRDGGSGLGLAMVAKLVRAHGGLVEWDVGPDGRGAVFRVRLAAARGTSDG